MPLFLSQRRKSMGRKSRYMSYVEGLKKINENPRKHSTPQSILEKLKSVKDQDAVITVPAGDENE